jgi:very-short-patch-repair endonuclease
VTFCTNMKRLASPLYQFLSRPGRTSRYEQQIINCLNNNDIEFVREVDFEFQENRIKKYDFYLPGYMLIIECDGQHHDTSKQVQVDVKYSRLVLDSCKFTKLLRIKYQDLTGDEQKIMDIIEDALSSNYQVIYNKNHYHKFHYHLNIDNRYRYMLYSAVDDYPIMISNIIIATIFALILMVFIKALIGTYLTYWR